MCSNSETNEVKISDEILKPKIHAEYLEQNYDEESPGTRELLHPEIFHNTSIESFELENGDKIDKNDELRKIQIKEKFEQSMISLREHFESTKLKTENNIGQNLKFNSNKEITKENNPNESYVSKSNLSECKEGLHDKLSSLFTSGNIDNKNVQVDNENEIQLRQQLENALSDAKFYKMVIFNKIIEI